MRFLAGFALCLLISALSAKADNPPILAVIDFFPFGYIGQDGTPKGMFFDMTEAIAKDSGIDIDARLMPVPRALRSASNGQVDMLISYKDPLMVPNVIFVGNVGCLTANVVPAKNSGITTMEDLPNRRIGTIGGGYFQKRFRDKIAYQEVSVPSNQAMLKMLVRNRLDGFVINSAVYDAFYYFESPIDLPVDWRNHVADPIRIDILETHLSIAINSPALEQASRITTSINRLRQNGTMADIFARYGSRDRGNCIPEEFR